MRRTRGLITCVDLAVLAVAPIFLNWNVISSPRSTIGLANTDNEGTLWWIWSKCRGLVPDGTARHVGQPSGVDFSRFATFNLVDELRAWTARALGCSAQDAVLVLSLFPTIALILNLWAGYYLGTRVFGSRLNGFVVAIAGVMTSQILLSTRTSLANILLAPGILAVSCVFTHAKKNVRVQMFFASFWLMLQMLCNVYNGVAFLFIVLSASLFLRSRRQLSSRIMDGLVIGWGAVLGLLPVLQGQLFLYTESGDSQIYRPVVPSNEIVDARVLVSSRFWFFSPAEWPQPEAGWIPLLLLIVTLIAAVGLLRSRGGEAVTRLGLISLANAMLISCLAFKVPGFGALRWLYFQVLFPLRGVSNFAKVIPLLCTLCICSWLSKTSLTLARSNMSRVGIALVLLFNSIDSIPRGSTLGASTSLEPVEDFYEDVEPVLGSGIIAHFPDYNYGDRWGFPTRFVQLAQIYTGREVANGRSLEDLGEKCAQMPIPDTDNSLVQLRERGISHVILHRRLMPASQFTSSMAFLEAKNLRKFVFRSTISDNEPEIYRSLDVVIFEIAQRAKGLSSCP